MAATSANLDKKLNDFYSYNNSTTQQLNNSTIKQPIHILNGDALKHQFPIAIPGKTIIARMCLADGPVKAATEEKLYDLRATFISENYPGYSKLDYRNNTVSELRKVEQLPEKTTVCFWFEDDLFCQVNFWYILHLILKNKKPYTLQLVRPEKHSAYAFGGMNAKELTDVYHNSLSLTPEDQKILGQFWNLYQQNETAQMLSLTEKLGNKFSFLDPVIRAHEDRLSAPGRPEKVLLKIVNDLNTQEFGPVFRVFCHREPIYGFGDLQVKRLLDKVLARL